MKVRKPLRSPEWRSDIKAAGSNVSCCTTKHARSERELVALRLSAEFEERRQALAAMIKPKTEEPDEV